MFVEERSAQQTVSPEARASGEAEPIAEAAPERLSLERLDREIGELAAHIAAATCRWLLLVAEFERRNGQEQWGFADCAEWLGWRCSLAPRSAKEHLRVARRLAELPRIRSSFAGGELTFSKVRALSRVATVDNEPDLLELARHATAAQLERLVRAYRSAASSDTAERAHERRHLTWHWEDDGSLSVRGSLAPEEGALFLSALEAARQGLRDDEGAPAATGGGTGASEEQPAAPRITNADSFIAMAESSMTGGGERGATADRHQVVVHLDADALSGDEGKRCELEDGPAIALETARRLGCDATLVGAVEGRDGKVSVGRKTRAVPAAMRRALHIRDRGCRFPGCNRRRFVDAHHIRHWARGGETSLDNLVQLCRHHHRLLHEGGFSCERKRGGTLVFRRPNGRPLAAVVPSPRGDPAHIGARNRRLGLAIDAETCSPLSRGEPMDLELGVWALCARDRLRAEREAARAGPG